ncbi:MAG: hypothetical protein KatS3mg054_0324 [Chloroflexus sp.]|nr:MAG: hypothetical protein KatS3mg054_0324 [Chloroflexus sp.]
MEEQPVEQPVQQPVQQPLHLQPEGAEPAQQCGKPWYQSATIWLNILMIIALVIPELMQVPELQAYQDELALIAAICNIIIRVYRTNTAIQH